MTTIVEESCDPLLNHPLGAFVTGKEKKISVCATDRTCGAGRVRLAAAASSAAVAAVG